MEVADYIFLSDHTYDDNTWVFRHKNNRKLTKRELYSLHSEEHLDARVVEVWAFILNELEYNFRGHDAYMVFFGSWHFVSVTLFFLVYRILTYLFSNISSFFVFA